MVFNDIFGLLCSFGMSLCVVQDNISLLPWLLDKPKLPSQGLGVRADAQCCKNTWLEELASESNTIQAQEDITAPGRQQAKTQENYMYVLVGLSSISLD